MSCGFDALTMAVVTCAGRLICNHSTRHSASGGTAGRVARRAIPTRKL